MRPQNLKGRDMRNGWTTPLALFSQLNAEFGFSLDAAADVSNTLCPSFLTDGLGVEWAGAVWCNPPYDATLPLWVRKGWEEAQKGAVVVMLVPVRTSVGWWHEWALKAQIRFVRGRLRFGGSRTNAPFDSAVLVFYPPLMSMTAK